MDVGVAMTGELIALGRAVLLLREEQEMSESELARAAGLTSGRLDAIEAGLFDPTYDVLLALAAGLGVTPAALIQRAGVEAIEYPVTRNYGLPHVSRTRGQVPG
jgi:transcriptional regulator with XRE-family HTH domain